MNRAEVEVRLETLVLVVHRRNGGTLTRLDPVCRLLDPVLGLDSLDLAEIMASVEKEFGVSPFERTAPRTWADVASALTGGPEGTTGQP